MGRARAAFLGAGILLALSVVPAFATDSNWGAGAWSGSTWRCTNGSQGQSTASKSECGPNGPYHHVYVDANVNNNFETAIIDTMTDDYDAHSQIEYFQDTSETSTTDVRVRVWSIPNGTAEFIYTTCAPDATYGNGTSYYEWCQEQILRYDPNRQGMANCLADSTCTDWRRVMRWAIRSAFSIPVTTRTTTRPMTPTARRAWAMPT